MKFIVRSLITSIAMAGIAAFVLAIPAYADCQPSTPTAGDDNIVCNCSDTNGVTGGGNDTINTNGADVSGPVAVDGGAGNDIITVDGGTVIGFVGVNGGTGNDTITVDNGATADGIIGVNDGMGNDTITVSDANASGLLIGVFG